MNILPNDPEKLKVYPHRGSEAIAASLKKAIEGGIYAYNERMPPERELADAFSASRGTVRKALNDLEALGYVNRRVGSGTFVLYSGQRQQSAIDVAELTSPIQLIETRLSIEPYLATLSCVHATGRDIENLRRVLIQLQQSEGDFSAYSKFDSEFHLLIAQCSGNPLILHIYQQIDEVRRHSQWAAMQKEILTSKNMHNYNKQHKKIFECIEKRDGQLAADWVNEHLGKARRDLLRVDSS